MRKIMGITIITLAIILLICSCSKDDRQKSIDKLKGFVEDNPVKDLDFDTFNPKKILDELDLTEEQWKDIEEIYELTKQDIKARFKKARGEGSNIADFQSEMVDDFEKRLEKVLNSDQLKKYKEMKYDKKLKKKLKEVKSKLNTSSQ